MSELIQKSIITSVALASLLSIAMLIACVAQHAPQPSAQRDVATVDESIQVDMNAQLADWISEEPTLNQ